MIQTATNSSTSKRTSHTDPTETLTQSHYSNLSSLSALLNPLVPRPTTDRDRKKVMARLKEIATLNEIADADSDANDTAPAIATATATATATANGASSSAASAAPPASPRGGMAQRSAKIRALPEVGASSLAKQQNKQAKGKEAAIEKFKQILTESGCNNAVDASTKADEIYAAVNREHADAKARREKIIMLLNNLKNKSIDVMSGELPVEQLVRMTREDFKTAERKKRDREAQEQADYNRKSVPTRMSGFLACVLLPNA